MESISSGSFWGGQQPIEMDIFQTKLKPNIVNQKIRTANRDGSHEELILEIKTKGELNLKVLEELMSVPGVESVNWVVESGETVG